jgi:hypothetical protein
MGLFDELKGIGTAGALMTGGVGGQQMAAKKYAGTGLGKAADPMDWLGYGAKHTQSEIEEIQRQAAAGSIEAQREMMRMTEELQAPYYAASENALAAMLTGATGAGEYEFTPTQRYLSDLEQGLGGIEGQLSARGRRQSTFGQEQKGQFVSDLTAEESNRQWNQLLDMIKMRQGATSALGGAYQAGGQNVGGIYSNLGAQAAQGQQWLGGQRQQSLQGLGTALQGLSGYMAQRGA